MGKTSFIQFVSNVVEDNFGMIPISFNNNDGQSIDELIFHLIEKLSKEFNKGYWGKSFVDGFLKRINEINILGTKLSLENQKDLIDDIKTHFSELLIEICQNFENKGIFIIIGDINGLSDNIEFTNWYKSLFESIQFYQNHVPIVFALISYPDEFNNLCIINESFTRIFKFIEIDRLKDTEIKDFFVNHFKNWL